MKIIQFNSRHRQKHFDFFNAMANPHFNICANIEISSFLQKCKRENHPFHPSMVYAVSQTANKVPAFTWRIREGQIVEHECVHPSFTVPTETTDVFSFCYVDFDSNEKVFISNALQAIEEMKTKPSFEDEKGRDDFLFLSSIPWISFNSLQHAMHSPGDSIPRITWGKYFEDGGKILLPLSVQVHHGLVDGKQVGEFFTLIQEYMDGF